MSYQVIARKWRPQTFSDLVGQSHVTSTLANAIKNNRVAHAYIFSGARGVGKTTAARILAKAMNCAKGPTAEPCGECDSCKEIAAGTSLDVIEIDAASNRGIDQIRELREMVRYAPAASRSKVVLLDEAHMLTSEASNALLKTLEEPPDRVIFVMATTQPEDLADTIRSRSQHFHFRALTFAEITGRLEEIAKREDLKIEPGALAVIARMAEGSLRDALSLLEQARAYCGNVIPDKEVRELLGVVPEDSLNDLVFAIAEGSAYRDGGHKFVEGIFRHDAEKFAHLFIRDDVAAIRSRLFQQRKRVAQAAFRHSRNHCQRARLNLQVFFFGDLFEPSGDFNKRERAKMKMLGARADGIGEIFRLCCSHHENHAVRRFFQGFQKRVGCFARQHVSFIEKHHLASRCCRGIAHHLAQFADLIDAAVRGRVDFDHVQRGSRGNFLAGIALAAWLRRRPFCAVHGLRQNPRRRRFSYAACAGKNIRMRDAIVFDRVGQR